MGKFELFSKLYKSELHNPYVFVNIFSLIFVVLNCGIVSLLPFFTFVSIKFNLDFIFVSL